MEGPALHDLAEAAGIPRLFGPKQRHHDSKPEQVWNFFVFSP